MKKYIIVAVSLVFVFGLAGAVYSATTLSGWAWSENIGWLSFSGTGSGGGGGGGSTGPSAGLIGWWKFDGNTNDSSSGGHETTPLNDPTFTTGKIGSAINFDGVDDRVVVTQFGVPAGAATVSAWFNLRTYGGGGGYGMPFNSAPFSCYLVGWSSSIACKNDYVDPAVSASSALPLNTWKHFTAVRNAAGEFTFYIDGIQSGAANQPGGSTYAGADLFIGSRDDGSYPFDGLMDDVRVYNRALSAAEVTELFEATGTGGGGGAGATYSVTVTTTTPSLGRFSGYAWGDNIGWVSFEQADINGCPTDSEDAPPNGVDVPSGGNNCTPRMDFISGKVSGWARLKSIPSPDGWLHLSGTGHNTAPSGSGVKFDLQNGTLVGLAWSSDIGWVDFDAVATVPGKPGILICTPGGDCPEVGGPITGVCTNTHSAGPINPGTNVTLRLVSVSGGTGLYRSFAWYDDLGHDSTYTPPAPTSLMPQTKVFNYSEADTVPGAVYHPYVVVTDSSNTASANITCQNVSMTSIEPPSADLKVWIGSPSAPLSQRNRTYTLTNPGRPVTVSWESTDTTTCRGYQNYVPANPALNVQDWSEFEGKALGGSSGSTQIILDNGPYIYRFGIQCEKTDLTLIPLVPEATEYDGDPIQSTFRIEITTSEEEEI